MDVRANATVDALWDAAAIRRTPVLSPGEQRRGLLFLRDLAGGDPIAPAALAEASACSLGLTGALAIACSLTVAMQSVRLWQA